MKKIATITLGLALAAIIATPALAAETNAPTLTSVKVKTEKVKIVKPKVEKSKTDAVVKKTVKKTVKTE